MATGYLGKISAIVTANTSDFSSKLNSAAKEVRSFASSMQSAISRAQSNSTSSLRGIYTEVQKLERALQSASTLKLSFKGFDASKFGSVEEAANQMRRMVSASEQVYKPLANAAKATESLSTAVRGEFQPALVRAQRQAELLNTALTKGFVPSEEAFAAVTRRVNETEAAIRRLAEAEQMVGRLSRGDSLKFTSPRTFDALTQAAAAQNASGNLPATTLARFGVGQQQGAVAVAAQRVRDLEARRESEALLGQSTASTDKLIAQETDRLEAQIRVLTRRNAAAREFADIEARNLAATSPDAVARSEAEPLINRARAEREFYEESRRLRAQAAADAKAAAEAEAEPLIRRARAEREFYEESRRLRAQAAADAKAAAEAEAEPLIRRAMAERDFDEERRRLREQAVPGLGRYEEQFADFGQSLNAANLRAFTAEMQVMQRAAISLAANVRGPVVAAMQAYHAATVEAMQSGTFEDPAVVARLSSLKKAFVDAAKAAGMSAAQIQAALNRAGDVGRAGVDKWSLALNQAAFAVDDFFSSTGGLEFKVRAVSNNITQLAFVLGGTKGLFIGLGAVIGAQVALGFMKFINNGRTAEDQTKALNDALARQKSLVEELAQAFQSLGDSITRKAFSSAGQEAAAFRKEINEIIKKQKELREAQLASLDPTVQRERATQGSLQRRLEASSSIGERVALQQQIDQSKRREREAAAAAAARPAPNGGQAAAAIQRAGQALFNFQETSNFGGEVPTAPDFAAIEAAQRRAGIAQNAQTPQEIRDQLQRQLDELVASEGAGTAGVDEAIRQLQELINSLEDPIKRALNALAINILEGAQKAGEALGRAQQSIANSGLEQSSIARQADEAAKKLKELADSIKPDSDQATLEAARKQQEALQQQATALANAARSVEQFAAAIDKVARQLAQTVFQEVEGRASQARRGVNEARGAAAAGVGGVPPLFMPQARTRQKRAMQEAEEDRKRADADMKRARAGQQEYERRERKAVREFEANAAAGNLGGAAQQLVAQRDEAQRVLDDETSTQGQRNAAIEQRNQADAALAEMFANSPAGQALAAFADELDAAAASAAEYDRQIKEQRESADRGRELAMKPGQRESEDLRRDTADIREYYKRKRKEQPAGDFFEAEFDAIQRREEEAMRQTAPTLFRMVDEQKNALLQGPSRAALNASDVSTSQGQQELNRLLRGDDSAKNVDLVNLQKEANRLLTLIAEKDQPVTD